MKSEQDIKDQIERYNEMIVKESNSYIKDALCAQRDILAWVIEPPLQQGFSLAPGESKRFSIDIPMKDIMGEL